MRSDHRKLSWREDWPAIPYLSLILFGIAVTAYDFFILQRFHIQIDPTSIGGVALVILGASMRAISRLTLRKAGFGLVNSTRLQIVEKQKIIVNGLYGHIRHPLYLGEMMRNMGFAFAASSLYGLIPMLLGNILLLFRIGIEEKMLKEEFGAKYEEYARRTKRLIPHVY